MKTIIVLAVLCLLCACNNDSAQHAQHRAGAAAVASTDARSAALSGSAPLNEDSFRAEQDKLFRTHVAELSKLGHMAPDFGMAYMVLGTYGWYTGTKEYFGAYAFSQAAYEQAKHAWFGHFEVLEGGNELWAEDDGDSDTCANGGSCPIVFDKSAIGMTIPPMSMVWFKGDKLESGWFEGAKVIGIKDDGRTLILDKRAPHQAEQWNMAIVPAGWVDMCACTTGTSIG
jgi:hypothetical protein